MELTPPLAAAVLGLYYATLGVLCLFGTHRLVLLAAWWRGRRRPPAPLPAPAVWPRVTVQLPLYNERFVAERLLRAVAALDYPRERLEVQVLDDSTDDTRQLVARLVAELAAGGLAVAHLTREVRTGFKAGALAAGLDATGSDLLAVFDADFLPPPDFLRRTVPWLEDPQVGLVQARWDHLNRDFSLATEVQAILLDGHFLIEHAGRQAGGCFFNFNGTAGVWRRQAIVEAGGWQADTLTEDLDLSYRAQLAGWRFVFLPDLAVPAELPIEVDAFKGQQHRWSRGSMQTGRKLLGRILGAPLPLAVKAEAVVHLTNNLSYPLMVVLALLVFPAMLLRRGSPLWKLALVDLPLFAAATFSVLVFYLVGQLAAGQGWRRQLRYLPAVMAMGIGLSVSNAGAVLGGIVRRGGTFHRTPKYRVEGRRRATERGAYAPGRRRSFWFELLLAAYFAACVAAAWRLGMWSSIPFLWLFLQGYATMVLLALWPQRALEPG